MGAFFGPIPLALEPRVRSGILIAGGLRSGDFSPEIQPANFMPRVTVPVLLINGHDDFSALRGAQHRKLERLGTSPEDKRLVSLAGGHLPSDLLGIMREVLDFLDRYHGAIRPAAHLR